MAAISLAVVVGAILRMALALSSGLWRDEAQSLAIAQLPSGGEVLRFLTAQESHPPLFYLIERSWVLLAGTSDVAVITLGVVPGILVVPGAALVAGWAAGSRAAVIAAWCTALSWPLVWQSGDARPYALLAVVVLGTVAAGHRALSTFSAAAVTSYVVGCVLLLYLHNWSVLVVGTLAVMTGVATWRHSPRDRMAWVLAHGVVAASYAWWVPALLRQRGIAGYPSHGRFPVEWLLVAPTMLLGVTIALLPFAFATLVVGARPRGLTLRARTSARWFALAAILTCVAALALWRASGLTIAHCAAILTPTALVAAACALGGEAIERSRARDLSAIGLVAILGIALMSHWYPKSNMREAAAYVSDRMERGDLVILYPASIAPAFARYAKVGIQMVTYPHQAIGSPVGFAGWWQQFSAPIEGSAVLRALDSTLSSGGRVWLLLQHRQHSDPGSARIEGRAEKFELGIVERLSELRAELRRRSEGPPVVSSPGLRRWARERIGVEAYTPPKAVP